MAISARIRHVFGAAALLCLLVAPIAFAGASGSGEPQATASASVKKSVKKLKKQFKQLQAALEEVSKQPGPQGPPGPQGAQGLPGLSTGPAGGDLSGSYPNPAIAGAAVTIPKLAFDPATQAELDTHKGSADHDSRYFTESESDARYWRLAGNPGTTGSDFLGTTDNNPLNLRVNNARGLRLEPASDGTNQSPNVIGGIADNAVTAGVHSATIAGGGRTFPADPATANRVTDAGGTVGGGSNNQAGDAAGTTFDRARATVGGGAANTASGLLATVGGGGINTASGFDATVPGGESNTAAGSTSFAAGKQAKALHGGAFVWGDGSTNADIASSAGNQFIARASPGFFLTSSSTLPEDQGLINTSAGADGSGQNGAFLSDGGAWTSVSDENRKQGFEAFEPAEVLAKVADLPVRTWAYEAEPGVRHAGPTAQDFRAAFGLGADDMHIASVDADGVALAAIKGLEAENGMLDLKLRAQRRRGVEQARQIASLEARLAVLERHGR